MHPAINSVTVTVILLARDLLEQSVPCGCRAVGLCPLLLQPGPAVPGAGTARVMAGSRNPCLILPGAPRHLFDALAPGASDGPSH